MAGAYKARNARGRYSQAGYAFGEDREMYIADVPAGSAQDELRDHNRAGYRSERPWREAPEPAFEPDGAAAVVRTAVASPARRKHVQQKTFLDRLAEQARRERKDVIACAVLFALILMMAAAWGQNLIEGARIQNSIEMYEKQTEKLRLENEQMDQEIELARGRERIINLAQNKLGMLRPERAQTETIYIRTPENSANQAVQNMEEPGMQLLDILLGLLNVFHIGE